MNTTYIEQMIEAVKLEDIVKYLKEVLTEEALVKLWNRYIDKSAFCKHIYTDVDFINEELKNKRPIDIFNSIWKEFDDCDKYFYADDMWYRSFNNLYSEIESPVDFEWLARMIKIEYKNYLRDLCDDTK